MKRAAIITTIVLLLPIRVHAAEIPPEIRQTAEEICAEYAVSPELVEAMAYEESRFTPGIINKSGLNYGLLQINPAYQTKRMERLGLTKEDLLTTRGNILVGVDLLAELFEQYEDIGDVLLQFGGFSEAKKARYHNKGILPPYITKVLERSAMYEQQHSKEKEETKNDTDEREGTADGAPVDGLDG